MSTLAENPIRVLAVHLAPGRRLPMRAVEQVLAEAGAGLVGDRYHGARHRQVSVQTRADLDDAAAQLGSPIPAAGTRRNITLSHGPLPTAPGSRLRIGGAELEVVRQAAPCRLLDDALGEGARIALRRRAGVICRVLGTGTIRVGDPASLT